MRVALDISTTLKKAKTIINGRSFHLGNLISTKIVRVMTREYCRQFSMAKISEEQFVTRIVNGDHLLLEMSSILKKMLEYDEKIQRIIVEELINMENQKPGIRMLFQMITQICSLGERDKKDSAGGFKIFESAYYQAYDDYWILRYILIKLITCIAENNNVEGKALFNRLEPNLKLIEGSLTQILSELRSADSMTGKDLIYQRWKFELL